MNTFINNYQFLNCTQEVINCLKEAKKITLLTTSITSSNYTLRPIHLCLSLIFNSKLIQKILNINPNILLNKKNILNVIYNYKLYNYNFSLNKNFKIDTNILYILNILNTLPYPFNTLLLFYFLWKQNKTIYSFIFYILNIQNYNLNIIKNYTKYFFPKIIIPTNLKDILNILDLNINLIGREKELKNINEILIRDLNRNIILLGETGIGKSIIIKKIASLIPTKIFLELNIPNLITYSTDIELIKTFFKFLNKYNNIILYCKDFHLLIDNSTVDITYLKNTIYKMLYLNKLQIIGTSVDNIYNKILYTENNLKFLFSKINIKEPTKYITLLIMKQYLKTNNIYWINDTILENIIDLSKKFINSYVSPKKELLILDAIIHKYKNNKYVSKKEILTIISQYSELPTSLILKETNIFNISNIELNLKKYVFGQDIAVTKIATSLKRTYTGLKDKNKPIGSWLLCGPSGTGKTELVKSLAYLLFGSEKELIRFDMSEFMEKHSISKLIGSPPGYVGCDEGGLLTEAVKKKPYSVILFDEIEKAHKDINNIMLQLLDEGNLTDSKGMKVDFTNTLIIYTSNLGCPTSVVQFKSFQDGLELSEEEYKFLSKNVDNAVKKFFRPEFLNRLDSVVVFKPLSVVCLTNIIDKFINNLLQKLKENNILLQIEITQEIKIILAKLAYHPLYGARPLKRIIEQFIEKPISELIINFKFKTPHLFSIFKDKQKETINYLLKKI
uniref:Clp protease ATP-binding subunit n=1 Tax=Cyclospora cayetanensis TaxID=88456 RepID=A0A193BM96_9EIME|nr:clp protease ATP-binding subunit [Cyclospora cayetanensis]ANN13282.1 clp protease ATP-binding subunit [Cyclospora cayetanensis]ANN13311.1 clp protease ATP-binding subunit [Cyclospora cayetanensis]ANN13340.1 clp protease ATP-binding subunit [Cyclospora cayetanensis]ANN13369.1 clp protease ATP-binding subunit [Cyclospora cayetanensis]